MPENQNKLLPSNTRKLFAVSFLVLVSVSLAFFVVINTFGKVEKFIVKDVRGNIKIIEHYSALSRDLDSVEFDIDEIVIMALRKPDVLNRATPNILNKIELIRQKASVDRHIFKVKGGDDFLDIFYSGTAHHLKNFSDLNTVLLELESINGDFVQDLDKIERNIGSMLVDYTLNKKDTSALRQLFALTPFCQQYNMQIQLLIDASISKKDPSILGLGEERVKIPEKNVLNSIKTLRQNLYTMASAEPPIDKLVSSLIEKTGQYKTLICNLKTSLDLFLENIELLHKTRQALSMVIVELEVSTTNAIRNTEENTQKMLKKTTRFILAISIIVFCISIVGWLFIRFIALHMEKTSRELQSAKKVLEGTNEQLTEEIKMRESTEVELQKSINQLLHSEKLSAIGQLSASIAHEFNNPLQGIMSILKGVARRSTLGDDDAQLMTMAVSECNRMRDLIKSLQDFNRPTSGLSAPIDIHATLESLLVLGRNEYATRKIIIDKRYSEDLPLVKAVGDQIKQVFLNLLNNATDACDEGGTITIETEALGEQVVVRIHDTGVGIKPEDKKHIFEPFFTTKPAIKGTGLGLSVSYGIIKKHGGEINVDSESGKGTTFSVVLPIRGGGNAEKNNPVG